MSKIFRKQILFGRKSKANILTAQQIQKIKQQKNNGYKKINDDNSLSLSNT